MLGRLFLPSLLGANPNEPFQPHPFTRVLPYESLVAWDFSRAVDSFAAEPTQDEAAGRLLADLRRWSGAHERVLRIVATSPELEDQGIGALSQAVKEVAEIGIALVEAHRDEAKIDERRLAAFRGTLAEHEAVQMAFDRNYLLHFLKGMLRPIALRQHTIAIQPGVQKLLDAYEMRPAS